MGERRCLQTGGATRLPSRCSCWAARRSQRHVCPLTPPPGNSLLLFALLPSEPTKGYKSQAPSRSHLGYVTPFEQDKVPWRRGFRNLWWTETLPEVKAPGLCSTPRNSQARRAHATCFVLCASNSWWDALKTGGSACLREGSPVVAVGEERFTAPQHTPSYLRILSPCDCFYK